MPGAVVGSAEFQLAVNLGNFNAGFDAAQRQAAAGSAKVQTAIDGNFRKIEQSAQRTNANLLKSFNFAAIAAGFAVIGGGAAAVNAALESIVGSTARLEQAQFRMTKTFGASAAEFSKFAQEQAKATGQSNVALQEGISRLSVLRNGYGLTNEQIKNVTKATLDVAAATGTDAVEAFERIIGVFRDGGESAEKLGLVLNDQTIKAFADLTDEQRKNFEQMDAVSKSQIRYNELIRQAAAVQGTAVERSESQVGSFKRLNAALTDLGAAVGTALVPSLAETAEQMLAIVNAMQQLNAVQIPDWMVGKGIVQGPSLFERVFGRKWGEAPPGQVLIGPGGSLIDTSAGAEAATAQNATNPVLGPTPTEVRNAQVAETAERKRRIEQDLKDRRDAADRRAQIEIDGLEKEKQAAERSYQAQRAALENQKAAEIKAAEDARDGAIRAIEQQAQAAEDNYRRQVIAAEKARDGELKAAQEKRDGAIRAIEAEQEAAKEANDALIRQFEIERDRARQAAEDRRDAAVDALDAEKRARENARVQEDRAQDDANRDTLRAIDARHDAVVKGLQDEITAAERASDRKIRAIDREIAKAREASQQRLDAIDRAADKEAARHTRIMRALDEEQDARLGILDAQLKALDAQEQAADAAERMANLQKRLADAQRGLTQARGTGSPQQIADARDALTRALRVPGNEIGIANARELLQQMAGQGAQAVEKAQQELSDAQQEIQREQTKQARDGERDRLEAAKDAIADEIAARKLAEDERNQSRAREIAADRDAEQKKLASRLAALEKRKKATADASKDEIEQIRDRLDAEKDSHDLIVQQQRDIALQAKRAIEDRRRAEDQADQDKRKQIADTYEEEQRQIKATYDDEETGVIPALRRAAEAAEREYARRKVVVEDAYKAEQEQIRATYDDPETGVIAKIKQQAEDTAREYAASKQAVNDRYQAERDRIRDVYDDPESGLFAKLEKSKQATLDALNDQIEKWRNWKDQVVKEIGDALEKLDEFIRRVGDLDNISIGNDTPDGRGQVPGGVGPPIPRGFNPGGDLAYGPVVRNASPDSYWTSGGTHGGSPAADIFAPKGSPIYAPVGGRMIRAGTGGAGGNWAILQGDDGRFYYFAHGNVPFAGGRVERGQPIGEVGNTGNAQFTASHLHYAIGSTADVFGERNGSGDITGDSSYWGEGGTAGTGGADDEIEIEILGRKLRVRARSVVPGQVGQWISEGLRLAGVPTDWRVAIAQIAAAESGERLSNGQVRVGTGNPRATNNQGSGATGIMQMMPVTFAENAVQGHGNIYDPIDNIAAAARYIERRYGSPWNTPYYRTGAFSTLGVEGYRDGTMIREPTLLAGLRTGRLGIAGETGQPERLLGVDDTRAYGSGGGIGYQDNKVINVNGVGVDEFAARIRTQERRESLLRGVLGRWR